MNKKDISIAVVIPVKDEVESLLLCIKSAFKQSQEVDELIVVGSSKDMYLLKTALTRNQLSKVKIIINNENKNEARNRGIKEVKSEYVLFLDHDMRLCRGLVKDLKKRAKMFDAMVVPERGVGGSFLGKVKKLERKLIMFDKDTTTPRFYKKSLFLNEKPFSNKFGLLDEWGFNQKLIKKKVKIGISASCVYVDERDLTMWRNAKKKFLRGMWMKSFLEIDKKEALRRTNPFVRGVKFYSRRIEILFRKPLVFSSLVLLKLADFVIFYMGLVAGYIVDLKRIETEKSSDQFLVVHDELGNQYFKNMYEKAKWSRYVDEKEKNAVIDIWDLKERKVEKESILDLGVGPGRWSSLFVRLGFKRVVGLDFSKEMLKASEKRVKSDNYKAIYANMEENIPLAKAAFDRVFCFRTFKYIENTTHALSEIERVLKRKGQLLLELPNLSIQNRVVRFLSKIYLLMFPKTKISSKARYFAEVRYYSLDEIEKLFRSTTFKVNRRIPLFLLPSVALPRSLDIIFFPLVKYLDRVLFRILPLRLFGRSWIVVLTKDG